MATMAEAAIGSPSARVTMRDTPVVSLKTTRGPSCPVVLQTRLATTVSRCPCSADCCSESCTAMTRSCSRGLRRGKQ